jgi:hypothetical protein
MQANVYFHLSRRCKWSMPSTPWVTLNASAEAARDFIMGQLVTQQDLQAAVALLDNKSDTLAFRLTVRLGAMLVVAIGLLATILKLMP